MHWKILLKRGFGRKANPAEPPTLIFNQRLQPMTDEEITELKRKIQRSKEQTARDSRVDQKTMQLYFNI